MSPRIGESYAAIAQQTWVLKAIEYVALASPVVLMARKSPGCFITNVGFVRYSKLVATMNGWAMSPVQRSVTTIPLRRTWNGDLWKERFHIAAKTNELPATAIAGRQYNDNDSARKNGSMSVRNTIFAFVRRPTRAWNVIQ